MVKYRLEKKLEKILRKEAKRKGIKYTEIEFLKVKKELVKNGLELKEVIIFIKKNKR
jgi:hypothetical protein